MRREYRQTERLYKKLLVDELINGNLLKKFYKLIYLDMEK